jgi:ribulose-phosphate 3-epimerase
MPAVCPAILASTKEQYHQQIEKIAGFAQRIQIDLTDGEFAKNPTIKPMDAWWPVGVSADFHLMYQHPQVAVDVILKHRPNMIIVHAEAAGDFIALADHCRQLGIKAGVALLPATPAETILSALDKIDHVLIFSGQLGEYGGHANFNLLDKVQVLKHHKPSLEIGWDGGINDQNISRLASGGVDVFDTGGYIQNAESSERAYRSLERIVQETGTT